MTDSRELSEAERCPECGEQIPPEAEACPECGARLFERGPEESYGGHFRQGEDQETWDPIKSLDEEGDLHQPMIPAFEDLVTVFQGTMSEAMTHRAALGARGYETYIRDDNTKVIDPFITGGYAFGVSLDAPKGDAAAIRKILDEVGGKGPAREKTPEERAAERVDKMGQQVILSAILLLPAPIGVVQAVRYFMAGIGLKEARPYRLSVAICGLLCIGETAILVQLFLLLMQ